MASDRILVSPPADSPYTMFVSDAESALSSLGSIERQLYTGDIFLLGLHRYVSNILWGHRSVILSSVQQVGGKSLTVNFLVPGSFAGAVFRVKSLYRTAQVASTWETSTIFERPPYGEWDLPPILAPGEKVTTVPVAFAPPAGHPPVDWFQWSRVTDGFYVTDSLHTPVFNDTSGYVMALAKSQMGMALPTFKPNPKEWPENLRKCLKGRP